MRDGQRCGRRVPIGEDDRTGAFLGRAALARDLWHGRERAPAAGRPTRRLPARCRRPCSPTSASRSRADRASGRRRRGHRQAGEDQVPPVERAQASAQEAEGTGGHGGLQARQSVVGSTVRTPAAIGDVSDAPASGGAARRVRAQQPVPQYIPDERANAARDARRCTRGHRHISRARPARIPATGAPRRCRCRCGRPRAG